MHSSRVKTDADQLSRACRTFSDRAPDATFNTGRMWCQSRVGSSRRVVAKEHHPLAPSSHRQKPITSGRSTSTPTTKGSCAIPVETVDGAPARPQEGDPVGPAARPVDPDHRPSARTLTRHGKQLGPRQRWSWTQRQLCAILTGTNRH